MNHPRNSRTVCYSLILSAVLGTSLPQVTLAAPPPLSPLAQQAVDKSSPQMREVLDAFLSLDPKPIEMLTAAQARKQPTMAEATLKVMKNKGMSVAPEKVGDVDNRKIDVGDRKVPVRVYTPDGAGPFPVIVYFRGGGFVIATLNTYDASCRALCNLTKAVVVSVDYRMAPENKWPAAHDDAYLVTKWIFAHAADLKGDASKVALVGESAGGNLAATTTLRLKLNHDPLPVANVLIYPVIDDKMDTPSYVENVEAKPLNMAMMKWFFGNYTSSPTDGDNKLLLPGRATKEDLTGLPPTAVITAQIDPLMSEGKTYSEKLTEAGVPTMYRNFEGVTHEFFGMGALIPQAKEAEQFAADNLLKAFSTAMRQGDPNHPTVDNH